jgi:hypothetical protein
MEEFVPLAKSANIDILALILAMARERKLDITAAVRERRKELSERPFYIRE